MYKVMIEQILGGWIIGKSVLCKDYATLEDATADAECYSEPYDYKSYEIRYYSDRKNNVICFDSVMDTGSIVYKVPYMQNKEALAWFKEYAKIGGHSPNHKPSLCAIRNIEIVDKVRDILNAYYEKTPVRKMEIGQVLFEIRQIVGKE